MYGTSSVSTALGSEPMTGAVLYARLRQVGQVLLSADEAGAIGGARRLAKADGLRVHQYRDRHTRGLSRQQIRTRPYSVCLTTEGDLTTIVRPDAA